MGQAEGLKTPKDRPDPPTCGPAAPWQKHRPPTTEEDVKLGAPNVGEDCGYLWIEGRVFDTFPLIVSLGRLEPIQTVL